MTTTYHCPQCWEDIEVPGGRIQRLIANRTDEISPDALHRLHTEPDDDTP